MVCRESHRLGVSIQVMQPQRPRLAYQQPENPAAVRAIANVLDCFWIDSFRDEFDEVDFLRGRLRAEDPQSAVSSSGEAACGSDNTAEDGTELQLRGNSGDRLEESLSVAHRRHGIPAPGMLRTLRVVHLDSFTHLPGVHGMSLRPGGRITI